MRLRYALSAGVIGAALAALVDPYVLPLAAVTVGAVAAALATRRLGAQRHFDAVGATFALTLGAAIPSITVLPDILAETPRLALVVFGALSALLVSIRYGVGAIIRVLARRVTEYRTASRIWDALSTMSSVILLAWSVVRIKERVVRTGALGIAAPLSLGLNLAGRTIDLPWYLDPGVDLLAIVYVGCVVVGFHTLVSWYTVLALKDDPLVQATGAKTKSAATTAGSKTKAVASATGDTTRSASESVRDVAGDVRSKASVSEREEDGWSVPGAGIVGRILGVERPGADTDEVE